MKIWSKIFAGMLAVGMFAGCNNESANEPEITTPFRMALRMRFT